MQIADPRKMGPMKPMAATGMVANAKAPPANMPAHRAVISICPPGFACSKKLTGTTAHMPPKMKAFRTRRCMVRRDTDCGFVTRHDDRALRPDKVDPKTITAAHSAA